ncbi:MAG: nucleotide sugar dehydrogenase [Candidatus Nitrosotenuis sp.]
MSKFHNLKSFIISKKKIIAVYGLGNVGGPLAAAWLRNEAKIIGVDISHKLLTEIKLCQSHKKEPFISEIFSNAIKIGNLELTDNGVMASERSHIKIVAVPVGLKKNNIDLSALKSVAKDIGQGLKKGDAVLISPSLPPGTSQNVVLPILEKYSNLKGEQDFFFIYNPERIFEGRALQDIEENYPAIVAGLGQKSLEFGEELLKIISKKGVMTFSSLANAEAEKLFEGVYRDVNIALANELSEFCELMGVNYWEARKGANSQPFCHLHYPGTGVGGLCIPVYPRFIIESSSKIGKHLKMVEFAREINDMMPIKCVNESVKLLSKNKIKLKDAKIAVLGLGFRGEVTDSRLSPTYTVVEEFLKKGCSVSVHDPYIFEDRLLPSTVILSKDFESIVKDASLIFISSDHKTYSNLTEKSFSNAKKPLLIFDGRNILDKKQFKDVSLMTIGIR